MLIEGRSLFSWPPINLVLKYSTVLPLLSVVHRGSYNKFAQSHVKGWFQTAVTAGNYHEVTAALCS